MPAYQEHVWMVPNLLKLRGIALHLSILGYACPGGYYVDGNGILLKDIASALNKGAFLS